MTDVRSAFFRNLPRSAVALGAGFLALALLLMASVMFSVRQRGDDAALRHALAVDVDLSSLQLALLDAEVGQRGYLLTGDAAFLEPYRQASDRLDRLLGRLETEVRDDADQATLLTEIRRLVAAKRSELAETLALNDAADRQGALRLVQRKTGMALMDRLRVLIGRMDAEQDLHVAARQIGIERVGLATSITTAVTLLLMGIVALAALIEVRKRGRLARFLPVEVASRLADGDRRLGEGVSVPAAIAFVDMRGSTALAERLTPNQLFALLTAFRAHVSAAAKAHGGMVDKFIGDGALVVFGALNGEAGSAAHALDFAADLLERLAPERGGAPAFRIGIGLHHGAVFCGVVGDEDRQEFTVLGDTVNVASRIEEATKLFDTDLLVSEAVLIEADADRSGWRQVSCAPLRGHHQPIALHTRTGSSARGAGLDRRADIGQPSIERDPRGRPETAAGRID